MTLLEKLSKARIDFQNAKIKKTGKNSFVGFDYYELHDILPKINELAEQYRFFCAITFNGEAKLKIFDIDKSDDYIMFTSPMATVNLKGAHDIQNLGAMQTYMRRYLYFMAFEITDNDSFDAGMGKAEKKSENKKYGFDHKTSEIIDKNVCPKCGKSAIIKGKAEYGGGYICYTKKGGCGAKFKDEEMEQKKKELDKYIDNKLSDIEELKRQAWNLIKRLPEKVRNTWTESLKGADKNTLLEAIKDIQKELAEQEAIEAEKREAASEARAEHGRSDAEVEIW